MNTTAFQKKLYLLTQDLHDLRKQWKLNPSEEIKQRGLALRKKIEEMERKGSVLYMRDKFAEKINYEEIFR